MGDKKIVVFIIFLTAVILFGGVFVLSDSTNTSQVTSSTNAKAQIPQKEHNFGNIPYSGGNVEKAFIIKNVGSDTLKLSNVRTSCHCTKARISVDGEESPSFGMDGISSWVGEVGKSRQAKLIVTFDPAFHGPQGIGPVNRFVSVDTNDKNNSQLTFTVLGTIVK
ncbi:MAG: hypothetical protein A2958_02375 [Candidatus Levybacteria bacterium RIFCSPLOWO2_01_FULL_38_13]|nr:MAG: hypothetical protein A2629_04005 [Candidatus Levybacteria bacterium RIFCSPHIGHO2_01_FULL_41_15]OGH35095.1 MAG: hypothetical protein A2958_02375 [Candidatus Levybacteria bacterium RIFCSPLOWO2_01_FULL_38_13]